MKPSEYYVKMYPAGKIVQSATGVPASLVVAFWSWETDFGTNNSSVAGNNHAGIKSNSKGAEGAVGAYAKYSSISSFAKDYARILLNVKGVGYENVIAVAKKNPKDYTAITKAMNASSWAEADYNVTTIVDRANAVDKALKTGVVSVDNSTEVTKAGTIPTLEGLSQTEINKYALIGIAVIGAIALVKK